METQQVVTPEMAKSEYNSLSQQEKVAFINFVNTSIIQYKTSPISQQIDYLYWAWSVYGTKLFPESIKEQVLSFDIDKDGFSSVMMFSIARMIKNARNTSNT